MHGAVILRSAAATSSECADNTDYHRHIISVSWWR